MSQIQAPRNPHLNSCPLLKQGFPAQQEKTLAHQSAVTGKLTTWETLSGLGRKTDDALHSCPCLLRS